MLVELAMVVGGALLITSNVLFLGWALSVSGMLYLFVTLGAGKLYAMPEALALLTGVSMLGLPLISAGFARDILGGGPLIVVLAAVLTGVLLLFALRKFFDGLGAEPKNTVA
jgi:hypothetical protein